MSHHMIYNYIKIKLSFRSETVKLKFMMKTRSGFFRKYKEIFLPLKFNNKQYSTSSINKIPWQFSITLDKRITGQITLYKKIKMKIT